MRSSDYIASPKKKTSKKELSSSSEEKDFRKKKENTSSEETPVSIKTEKVIEVSSSEESSSDEVEKALNVRLPKDLVGIVDSYNKFSGRNDIITKKVNYLASYDKVKGIIYYISYDKREQDYYLIRLDLSTEEKQKLKLNLERYALIPKGCTKKKNFLFIYNRERCILLNLKNGRVIYKGNFSTRGPGIKNHVEIVAINEKHITIVSTPASKRYNITVFNIKTGEITLSEDVATRFPVEYVGTGPTGEIIFLIDNKLVKYY